MWVRTIVVVLVALVGRAGADDLRTAQQHLDAGVALYGAGNFADARVELAAAQVLAPDKPNPYRWLALVDVRLGDCASALVHIESFAARVAADDARLGELVRLRDQCRSIGHIRVVSSPTGATVRVDQRATPMMTPADLALSVGSHVIVVGKPGFESVTQTVEAHAAGVDEAMFTLPVAAVAEPHHRWWLWTTIGVGVVAIAAGTTYALTRGRDDPRLPPIACDATGCR